jgi:long-subunit acyl-CoA synthetase (AMP-forming)
LRLPSPVVIFELLEKANAKALIYDSSFQHILRDSPLPVHPAVAAENVDDMGEPLPEMPDVREDETALVFHTSGSTSGSPKLVPCSYRWLSAIVHKVSQMSRPRNPERQDVTVWM